LPSPAWKKVKERLLYYTDFSLFLIDFFTKNSLKDFYYERETISPDKDQIGNEFYKSKN